MKVPASTIEAFEPHGIPLLTVPDAHIVEKVKKQLLAYADYFPTSLEYILATPGIVAGAFDYHARSASQHVEETDIKAISSLAGYTFFIEFKIRGTWHKTTLTMPRTGRVYP